MIIVIFVLLIVAFIVGSHFLDRERVAEHIRSSGGSVESVTWKPFAKGWFGENGETHFEVVYRSSKGRRHVRTCKTSFWTGVYWADDGESLDDRDEILGPCRTCGKRLTKGWQVCPFCGTKVD